MSKTASPVLFELIHSLSKSEKRYFKIYASRHTIGEENNGIRIFNFIDDQNEFDEKAVHEHFKGEAFLNQFPITKNRLYDQILNALDAFHASKNIDAQLYKMVHSIHILYEKGLYQHAEKELKKTKRLASKHSKTAVLLQLANEEKKIIETQAYQNASEKELQKHIQTTTDLTNQYNYFNQLWLLKSRLFMRLNQMGQARSEEDIKQYKALNAELENIESPSKVDFECKYLFFHFKSAFHFAILENEESLAYLEKNYTLFKEHPKKLKEHPNQYFSILTNLIHSASIKRDTRSIHKHLNELKAFQHQLKSKLTEDLNIKLFSSINSIELKVLNQEGSFKKASNLGEDIEEGLIKYMDELTPYRKAYLAFNLAISYFGSEEFNLSLKWTNEILNNKELDQKEDILSFAHLLNLLIHYELDNRDLLPYAIKNTKRFLSKRKRSFKFETIFIKYLSKIINAEDKYEIEDFILKVDQEIAELKEDPFESVAFDYFDFHLWLKSKLKNKPFQLIKREDYLSKSA